MTPSSPSPSTSTLSASRAHSTSRSVCPSVPHQDSHDSFLTALRSRGFFHTAAKMSSLKYRSRQAPPGRALRVAHRHYRPGPPHPALAMLPSLPQGAHASPLLSSPPPLLGPPCLIPLPGLPAQPSKSRGCRKLPPSHHWSVPSPTCSHSSVAPMYLLIPPLPALSRPRWNIPSAQKILVDSIALDCKLHEGRD